MKKRRIKVMLIATVTVVLLVPAVAFATGGFTDVGSDNIFKDDIQWMADNGITRGCNPPANDMYCPEANVTRQQMAAFMHRLGDRVLSLTEVAERSSGSSFGNSAAPLISFGIEAPSDGGVLAITASGVFYDEGASATDGIAWIEIDGSPTCGGWDAKSLPNGAVTWDADGSQSRAGMATVEAVVVAAGHHQIDVCSKHFGTAFDFNGKAVATWTPPAP